MDPNHITYFGETDARNKKIKFGIKAKDRLKHVYVIGKTGMGKSTILENMAIQDIQNGNSIAFVDPHGGTAEKLLEYVPEHRIKDVVYFAPFDIDYPISFNVMEDIGAEKRHLVVSGLMSAFMKLFGEESFSDRMEYILQNTILALLEYPGATMLGINKMLVDKEYRNKVIANISDPSVKTYWTKEYAGYTERFAAEAIPAIQNKIGQFTSNPLIRNIIGQEKSSFDFRDIMDKGKIMIINLSKGRVGESNANLIGSMLITKIYLAAMSRADNNEQELAKLPNFYLYVDEFQSFANKSFADILSEARKYKLNLTIAHQYIEQMEEEVRDAVFGNVGTMVTFRVGAFDAEVLEKEFAPTFEAADLVNLGIYQIYLKLMIDGVSSQPFSAKGMAPIARPEINFKEAVIKSSREQFAKPRSLVEKSIIDWHDDGAIRVKPSHAPQINQIHQVNTGQFQREPWHDAHRARSEPPIQPSFSSKFRLGDTSYKAEALTVEKKQAFMKAAEILRHHPSPPPLHKTTDGQGNTISLSTLKPSEEKKNPTKENISSLKDALSRVIHKPEVKNNPSHPNEVPEDVLRNLLKMDDTK
ncbi:MAG: hypothetical protein A3G47_02275 [Candidatus Zambryskibacteria bacterium RIFCSPLOWO2_12_FULL_39_45]|uniref:Type IV secretion system coupling protein TraD DNA-binding domain-containing protein n=3 Tax=Candidatus Zambryskiibacteriota TaxID=1817925 RepID=A0A1G2T8U9_9BACT|nr:MAG: hypothetical protein UT81_C0016G0009 [Parcubacteria group bacterium GW2011_GWA2_40_14]OHA93021.1 MAG: hypothetical protein A2W58_02015 [Candidatus Zambryskibacteria bacterium RIFCSPHIGHO2_02_38_10.5]OHA99326.1 MAG: hypothetical protein A3E32_00465 [Candidatus Zambryskibacteria bacterium RIFCSPHIGHO2_12_FULL_38_37]OHB07680.1 MAG: hypothetical protein A2W64_00255 [Candidatus Zambryskibacteria bacterium RIFCSPLOWO2_02_39_10]OHB09379.1 MAG: hypothetical protein A3I21_01080 [Candidatus Zambr